ncbi:hypothetical protein HMPREF0262_03334 [Clostridium sp. ATCC 29733]|nr:hypothetical protein HMPREF0262_03334 [Clostridium sp. ATCC 29733]
MEAACLFFQQVDARLVHGETRIPLSDSGKEKRNIVLPGLERAVERQGGVLSAAPVEIGLFHLCIPHSKPPGPCSPRAEHPFSLPYHIGPRLSMRRGKRAGQSGPNRPGHPCFLTDNGVE